MAIFFGNAVGYRQIEESLKIKGQGDKLEASTKIFAENLKMIDNNSNQTIINNVKARTVFHYPDADFMPVFCLFVVLEDDCITEDSSGKICLSKSIKDTITSHFPEADSVAIINNPKQFIKDIKKSISKNVVADLVNYFYIDNGFPNKDGTVSLDIKYFKYLTQDTPPSIVENIKNIVLMLNIYIEYFYAKIFILQMNMNLDLYCRKKKLKKVKHTM